MTKCERFVLLFQMTPCPHGKGYMLPLRPCCLSDLQKETAIPDPTDTRMATSLGLATCMHLSKAPTAGSEERWIVSLCHRISKSQAGVDSFD